jgi:hypothetical protein
MNQKDKDELERFSEECSSWLMNKHNEYQDPIMMGGVMMRATMELYLSQLSDEDIHRLLDVVVETIPQIRRQQVNRNSFLHEGNKVIH